MTRDIKIFPPCTPHPPLFHTHWTTKFNGHIALSRGLEAVKGCERIYLEAYTSILLVPKERLVSQSNLLLTKHRWSRQTLLYIKVPYRALLYDSAVFSEAVKIKNNQSTRSSAHVTPFSILSHELCTVGGLLWQTSHSGRQRDGGVRSG